VIYGDQSQRASDCCQFQAADIVEWSSKLLKLCALCVLGGKKIDAIALAMTPGLWRDSQCCDYNQ